MTTSMAQPDGSAPPAHLSLWDSSIGSDAEVIPIATPKHALRHGLGTRIRQRFAGSRLTLDIPPRIDLGRKIPDFTETGAPTVDPWA